MRYKGKIKELNHIIISDPSYDESVTCRYENNNLKEKDWYVDIDIKPTVDKIEDLTIKGTEFFLFLSKDRRLSELRENGAIRYLSGIELKETEIGMDTACVALGINEKADEIEKLYFAENIEDFTTKVHALKSSAKMVGLMELSEMARLVEAAGKNNDMDYVKDNILELLSKYRSYREVFAKL